MKKFLSLMKASSKGQLNLFKIKSLGKFNTAFIGLLFVCVLFTAYSYAEIIMNPLHEVNLAYIGISLFSFAIVIALVVEGIYKAQGIIFEAKDNDLLFSMPIKKSYILTSRILKMLIFTYLWDFVFLGPCLLKYVMLVDPPVSFYLLSLLYFLLLPLIPLVIALIVGYVIKTISISFKRKRLVQTLTTLVFFLIVMVVSFMMEGFVNNILEKATSLNDLIKKIYLPIGLYIDLINNFNWLKLIELVLISILPFILFILLFTKNYDNIINRSKENVSGLNKKRKVAEIRRKSVLKTLTIKEIKNYFSIPIYIINTILPPILMLLFTGILVFKGEIIINTLIDLGFTIEKIMELSPYIFIAIVMGLLTLSTITACSISLEGKKYSLLKSFPIREKDFFLAKILLNDLIMIPAFVLGAIVYIFKFEIFNYNIIFILLACFLLPHLNGQLGLVINLMFPKLEFNSPVEVVKQGLSVIVSMLANMVLAVGLIYSFYKLMNIIDASLLIVLYFGVIVVSILILDKVLNSYGRKRFMEID